ncbi:Uncharacterised protein [Actinobacillus pleuropneumoniae]|nr:Uncharacterised protein [Actinobacillus pleuropneumoniae]
MMNAYSNLGMSFFTLNEAVLLSGILLLLRKKMITHCFVMLKGSVET